MRVTRCCLSWGILRGERAIATPTLGTMSNDITDQRIALDEIPIADFLVSEPGYEPVVKRRKPTSTAHCTVSEEDLSLPKLLLHLQVFRARIMSGPPRREPLIHTDCAREATWKRSSRAVPKEVNSGHRHYPKNGDGRERRPQGGFSALRDWAEPHPLHRESIVVRAPSRGTHHADSSLLALMANVCVKPHIMGQDAQGRDSCIKTGETVMVSFSLMAQSSRLEAVRWLEVLATRSQRIAVCGRHFRQ